METNLMKALKLCKGNYQRDIVKGNEALGGGTLTGKAKQYSGRYQQSVYNLLGRLDVNGIPYVIHRGPRGGWLNSRLEVVEPEKVEG